MEISQTVLFLPHGVTNVDRRGLLQTLSLGAATIGSGCVNLLDSRRPSYLEDIVVRNFDDVGHEYALTIEQDGSVVHEAVVELAGTEGLALETVACEWSGRGPFVVTCTLDGADTETIHVDDAVQQGTGEYANLTFTVSESGALDWSGFFDDGGQRCHR